ncbi:hypothetical protein RND81_01G195700 [Saponaria officinalis]|uniref:RING-type E3 ubiquitin transferase n=3 Tax=Saponaria officinalis TaxID=3572 RepID=A0AAW1NH34_SAPOF
MGDDDKSFEMNKVSEEIGGNCDNDDEMLYVAVSKEFRTCKSTLIWALQNIEGKKLCLVHVHQPSQTMSILGGRFHISSVAEEEVMAYQEKERRHMLKVLDEYIYLCTQAGVRVEKLYIEMRTVENGLVELITQNKIERLVMGAAADNRYSRKMTEPKSNKANHVCRHAPDFCHIWFVCKGHLIYTREGTKLPDLSYKESPSSLMPRLTRSTSGWSPTLSRVSSQESFEDVNQSSTFSLSHLSIFSKSPETATEQTSSVPLPRTEDREHPLRSLSLPPRHEQTSCKGSLHDQLNEAIADAKTAKQETFQESFRRHQAEKEAIDAISKAKAAENFYHEELRRRKELEKELTKIKEDLENTKKQRDVALEELQTAMTENSSLKGRLEKSKIVGGEIEDKLRSSFELLQSFRQL